jgi:hypothetical protein
VIGERAALGYGLLYRGGELAEPVVIRYPKVMRMRTGMWQ